MKKFLIIILNLNIIIFDNVIFCKQSNICNTTLIHIGSEETQNEFMVKITDNESEKEYIGLTKTIDGQEIIYFLGIPYAEPPVGTLRFKRPIPYKYKNLINATEWQHSCHQLIAIDPTGITLGHTKQFSEDCLHLNIWAPMLTQALKPVMVFVHGGAFIGGTNTADLINGEMIASIGDVVVVTINYRVNIFGFLYSGTSEAPGNAGLWDQVLALEWVQQNINTFGGNPNKVTIFGESSGAFSVSLHILSPVSRHLFQNAILMSGSALTHLSGDDPKQALKRWTQLAKEFNCDFGFDICNKSVECLRNISANDLFTKFLSHRDFISDFVGFVPLVVYGNQFLPIKPIESLKKFDFKRNFSLLSGFTDNEGALFVMLNDLANWNPINPRHITLTEGFDMLKNYTFRLRTNIPIIAEDVNEIYLSQIHENNTNLIKQRIGAAIGDFYLTCPTNLFNKYVYSADTANNKVFQYLFSANSKATHIWCPESMGACHGSDIHMAFGHPLRYPNKSSENEKLFSKSMINTLTYFAKNDKPPRQEDIKWQSFYKIKNTEDIVQPYYQFLLNPKPDGNFGFNYKDFECEKLWKPHIENQ